MKFAYQALFDFASISEAIDFGKGHGFDGVEIALGNPFFYQEFMNGFKKSDFPVLVHSVEAFDLLTPIDEIRSVGIDWLTKVIDNARLADVKVVTIHLGQGIPFAVTSKKVYLQEKFPDLFHNKLDETLDFLASQSLVAVENVGSFRFKFVKELIEKYIKKGLKLTWDLGHTFLLKDSARKEEDFFITNKDAIANIHIHDNLGFRDEHNIVGNGKIDFKRIFSRLKDWRGFLTMEVRPRDAALESFIRLKGLLE
ncbi:MAG TPA: sugar phosphate isomerase/epimerase [bacterium (Candidatus Stahlbacteria)]|nr:sugar phosphate isomerase/epimerase [Candidatus Stahlbacteria bacterium]